MNLLISSFSQVNFSYLNNYSLPSLTPMQKRIITLVTAAFACLALAYVVIKRCYFKEVDIEETPKLKAKEIQANEIEESIKEEDLVLSSPYLSPSLLDFGQVRKGTDGGEAPDFMGLRTGDITVIDNEKLWTATFSCCIHTTESKVEILKFIKSICIKLDLFPNTKRQYLMPFCRLYNNLVHLHDSLPGETKEKEVKIYWNQNIEEVLFPYFLNNEDVEIDNLLFAIVPGESIDSPFQASIMDFTRQLQFVGVDKDKIMKDLQSEVKRLSQAVLGKDILSEVKKEIDSLMEWDIPLMQDAQTFTLQNNLRIQLLAMEAKGEKIDFEGMDADARSQFLQDSFKSKLKSV